MRHAILIFLFVLYALSIVGEIMSVGKERKPVTTGMAAVTVLIQTAIVAWLVSIW